MLAAILYIATVAIAALAVSNEMHQLKRVRKTAKPLAAIGLVLWVLTLATIIF